MGSDNTTLVVGTSAGGNQIVTSTNIVSGNTSIAAGTGISLLINQFPQTEAGVNSLTSSVVANIQHTTSARDVHFRLAYAAENFTAGKICFFIDYWTIKLCINTPINNNYFFLISSYIF